MAKLRAEWFWIERWDRSDAALLPMEAAGVYRTMLSQAWLRGAKLPNNHELIQKAIRCTKEEWERSWPLISKWWRVEGDNLVDDTQLEVYAESKARSERASERGRAGAQAKLKHNSSTTQAVLEHKPPSPSPSPSPSKNGNEYISNANPLVDRAKFREEGYRLIREISDLTGKDPTEILGDASEWKGYRQVNLDSIKSDDRLAHTLAALRKRRRELDKPPETASPPEPAWRRAQKANAEWEASKRDLERASGPGGGEGGIGRGPSG